MAEFLSYIGCLALGFIAGYFYNKHAEKREVRINVSKIESTGHKPVMEVSGDIKVIFEANEVILNNALS